MHEIWLSVGRHRKETKWKNKKFTWPELLTKLSTTQRTGETVKEYAAMNRDEQDAIKDIGGFVGGIINGGRRKKNAVSSRSIITLDIDTGTLDFWDEITTLYGQAMCIYSTHKHTSQVPRYRVIIPMSTDVLPDQYQAIARKIADSIGMDYFDPTTFQPERLMYWPSTPKDGEFYFQSQEGPFLDPGRVLAKYADWQDSSQWPMHPRERERVREGITEAQDPTEKTGVVGAFCRAYSISEAIEAYLQDMYTEAGEGRYTYKHGSTAGGLVVYGDKFAYSHHGTDPVSGTLCNSFDLVRLHRYGRLDARTKEDTPINRHPSFIAMAELARKDGTVNLDLVKQQTARAMDAFAEEVSEGAADDWLKKLETDKRDQIVPTAENLLTIFRNDPNLKGKMCYNEFAYRPVVRGALPWDDREGTRYWVDEDDAGLRWYLETSFRINSPSKIKDAALLCRLENRYHPVREYLQSLIWDGRPRVEGLLHYYLGAEDSEYIRTVTRKMLIASVARVMQPGIKFDTALVLIGPQGSAKSSFIRILGGDWYSESFGKLDKKDAVENIRGVWLMEIPELAGFKNAEVEDIKHFLAKCKDEFRPSYGEHVQEYPRQTTFWPTSNKDDFNKDPTGGRRFWPVNVIKSTLHKGRVYNELERERGQIWAEAVHLWTTEEDLHLDERIESIAEEIQYQHTEADPWEDTIREMIDKPLPDKWDSMTLFDRKMYLRGEDDMQPAGTRERETITAMDIWLEILEGSRKDLTPMIGKRIANIMRRIENWQIMAKKRKLNGNAFRVYERKIDFDGL